jgi:hypothetical protein
VLPDFREVKEKLQRSLMLRLRAQVKKRDPVLAMIRTMRQHEGRRHVYSTDAGRERSTDYQPVIAEITVSQHETVDWGTDEIVRRVDAMADQMIGQIVPGMFAKLRQVTEETGNVVSGAGRPFSFEMFLEAIEKIQMEFDEQTGEPEYPTIVMGPELYERVRSMLPEWDRNEEYKARLKAVIARKRAEWDDRESNRKLVD